MEQEPEKRLSKWFLNAEGAELLAERLLWSLCGLGGLGVLDSCT